MTSIYDDLDALQATAPKGVWIVGTYKRCDWCRSAWQVRLWRDLSSAELLEQAKNFIAQHAKCGSKS